MSHDTTSPFSGQPPWVPPPQFLKLGEPPHRALAAFIHGCAPDEATRTAATTALVLCLWQLGGQRLARRVPSLLLVHPDGQGDDPIDDILRGLVYDEAENRPRVQTQGPCLHMAVEHAPEVMRQSYLERQELERELDDWPWIRGQAHKQEERFHAAATTAYGDRRCRPYSEAWHAEYGLLTGPGEEIILRINGDEDLAALAEDAEHHPGRLTSPEGVGKGLYHVEKSVSYSGVVCHGQAATAAVLAEIGLPVFLVPHLAGQSLTVENMAALGALAQTWRNRPASQVEAEPGLPAAAWVRPYQEALRRYLAVLPYGYAFVAQQAIHQLAGVCGHIVGHAAWPGTSMEEKAALIRDLYGHALRGMVLSLAGLAWFGLWGYPGLAPGPQCGRARRILAKLREGGPASLSALNKNHHLGARERDQMLGRLAGEGLVRIEGKMVVASTYQEFVEALYAREELPPAEAHWPDVAG